MANAKQMRVTYQTTAFRLSYPSLFEAKETLNSKPGAPDLKYGITMLFPKKAIAEALKAKKHPAHLWIATDTCAGFWSEIVKVARGNFGPKINLAGLKLTKFRDGDKPKDSGKIEENEKGYIVVRTTSKDKPQCLRQDKTVITDPGELYAGCWVRALLTIAPFYKPNHGVTIYLAGVQKLADDQPFSSRPRAEDEFDAVAMDASGVAADGSGVVASEGANPWEQGNSAL
ncbi:MAG: ssDNA-binding protein [Patescibacteria group bacterium]